MKRAFAGETGRSADLPARVPFFGRGLAAVRVRLWRRGKQRDGCRVMRTVTTILGVEFKGIGFGRPGIEKS